jgi:T5SS/PEP-CTERM-associated repeat protein
MKTKSTQQTTFEPSWKTVLLLATAALMICISPAVACLAETSWTDGTGSWFVAANWLNQQLPTVGIGAQINNGGTAQVNGPGAVACDLTVGFDTTESGTVSVDSGTLAVTQEAEIGANGKGTLTINNGGNVTAQFLTIAALQGANSSGTVSVNGSSSIFTATGGAVYVGGDPAFSSVSINFPAGQNFSPQITYDTNHVYLYLASNNGS